MTHFFTPLFFIGAEISANLLAFNLSSSSSRSPDIGSPKIVPGGVYIYFFEVSAGNILRADTPQAFGIIARSS
jgi:hypothetical protein